MITLTEIGILGKNWRRSCVLIYGSFTAFNRWFSAFGYEPTDAADDEPGHDNEPDYDNEDDLRVATPY